MPQFIDDSLSENLSVVEASRLTYVENEPLKEFSIKGCYDHTDPKKNLSGSM
ncbi:MAG TPA: hypothetical protein VEP90_27190 [Methylomirabilota bacterium]|nr:hypothetical protein [Methylomirabilota bacterium]